MVHTHARTHTQVSPPFQACPFEVPGRIDTPRKLKFLTRKGEFLSFGWPPAGEKVIQSISKWVPGGFSDFHAWSEGVAGRGTQIDRGESERNFLQPRRKQKGYYSLVVKGGSRCCFVACLCVAGANFLFHSFLFRPGWEME